MTIVVAQSNVGTFPNGTGNTATVILNNVTGGNNILVVTMVTAGCASATIYPNIKVTDTGNNTYTDATPNCSIFTGSSNWEVEDLAYLQSVVGGTHTITSTSNGAANTRGWMVAMDVTNLSVASPVDIFAKANSVASIGPTASPTQTNEIAFAFITYKSNSNTALFTVPSGYTQVYANSQGATYNTQCCLAYLTPLTTSGQSITFNTPNAVCITTFVTFKGSAGIVATPILDINVTSEFLNVAFHANSAQGVMNVLIATQEINIANLSNFNTKYNVTIGSNVSNINVAQSQYTMSTNTVANTYTLTIISVDSAFPTYNITVPILNYTV